MINVRGGHTIEVWRRPKAADRFGDKEEVKVGTIDHVVFQWGSSGRTQASYHPSTDFQETSQLTAVVYAPRNAAVKLQPKDRIVWNGKRFQVSGDRAFDETHPITGTDMGYYFIQVDAVV